MKERERFPKAVPVTPAPSPFALASGVPQADKLFPAAPVLNLQRTEKENCQWSPARVSRRDMNAAAFHFQALI